MSRDRVRRGAGCLIPFSPAFVYSEAGVRIGTIVWILFLFYLRALPHLSLSPVCYLTLLVAPARSAPQAAREHVKEEHV